jgi:AraC family transcriptional regulator
MIKQYALLENVLTDIEKGIKDGINLNTLADKYALSERHLRRLFKFAFKQTLAGYIRSRKLAVSLGDLLKTDFTILDIALDYGFEYEQSYRRAFKREFGITPGEYRKAGHIARMECFAPAVEKMPD